MAKRKTIKPALLLTTMLTVAAPASAWGQAVAGDQARAASQGKGFPGEAPAAQRGPSDTPDIIVTARRVEERLQDVPISITVFNQQQVSNRNIVNATDLATYTPSLSSNSNFGQENSSFAIRGFVQDTGTPPSVGVYFADVVAPRGPTQGVQAGDGAGPGSFYDLQNIQVLKGPQGTLFGRNTTGGAILFVPQKPTSTLGGYVEGSYGNYDMRRVQAALNTPLTDRARFRIAVDHQQRDGYVVNDSGIGPRRFNDIDYTAVRASLVVDLTPDLENYTIASWSKSNTHGSVQKQIACAAAVGFGAFACPQQASQAGSGFYHVQQDFSDAYSRIQQWQVINTTTWKTSDVLTIKNIASYAQFTDDQLSPLFGENWFVPGPARLPLYFTGIVPAPGARTANQSTATEELQLQGTGLGGRLSYQTGGYVEISDPLGDVGARSPNFIVCQSPTSLQCTDVLGIGASAAYGVPIQVGSLAYSVGRTRYRNHGLYAQATYALLDTLKITGGFRYTWDKQANVSTRTAYRFPVVAPFTAAPVASCTDPGQAPTCSQRLTQTSRKPTWLVDLEYKPAEDILVYAKYARGYRAGGIFPNAPIDHRVFLPEKVDSYEAGVKTTFRGDLHGTFNVSGFYNDFSSQQLQAGFYQAPNAPVSPTQAIINAGKSRIWGAEVEASITPFRGLVLDASYTYLNATIRKIDTALLTTRDPNYVAGVVTIPKGAPLALSPRNKVSVTGTYTLPLDPRVGRISVGATFTHTDRQLTNYLYYDNPTLVAQMGGSFNFVPKTDLLNLNASWNSVFGTHFDVSMFATNVTQRRYFAFIPGLGGAGFESAVLGQPRFYGGRVRYRF